jgi:tetratricopeptide (TPR) repeat protein
MEYSRKTTPALSPRAFNTDGATFGTVQEETFVPRVGTPRAGAPSVGEKTLVASNQVSQDLTGGYRANTNDAIGDIEHVAVDVREAPEVFVENEPELDVDKIQAEAVSTMNSPSAMLPDTPECQKAEQEVQSARSAEETADRLFHYRRALRLCPQSPDFHLGLGDVYLSLGRKDDAEYEYREALRIEPTHRDAVVKLGALNQPETY